MIRILFSSHFSALIRTVSADLGTLFAMIVLEHIALLSAFITNLGAKAAMIFCKLSTHGHHGYRHLAHHGTFNQHAYAILSRIQVRLIKACIKAFAASLGTLGTGIDTSLHSVCFFVTTPINLSPLFIFKFYFFQTGFVICGRDSSLVRP